MEISESSLAILLHEIEKPVNIIEGFVLLLERNNTNRTEQMFYLQMITEAQGQLQSIVGDVISYCKYGPENKKHETFFDPAKTVESLCRLYEPVAAQKGLVLKRVPASRQLGAFLFSDEQKLRQILENLLVNAIKYTENGTVEIGHKANKNKQIVFYVQDTGIGIKKEDIDSVFDLFFRSSDVIGRNIQGTGIGLSVAWRLAKMLGTEIQLETEYGKGSSFKFTLYSGV